MESELDRFTGDFIIRDYTKTELKTILLNKLRLDKNHLTCPFCGYQGYFPTFSGGKVCVCFECDTVWSEIDGKVYIANHQTTKRKSASIIALKQTIRAHRESQR